MLRGHLLAGNELPEIWIPDDETRDDRETVRSRLDVGNKQTRVKTQIQMLLKRNRIKKPEEIRTTWTKEYRKWLNKISDYKEKTVLDVAAPSSDTIIRA